jgi:hypothetical protein
MTTGNLLERRAFLGGAGALLLTTLAACRPKPSKTEPQPELPPYTGPLVEPVRIPRDFVWRQRVHAFHGERDGAFDSVVQKDGEELLVVGLTPFGTRGFSLRQEGKHFTFEKYVPFELPFSPEAVLIDIHRAFFYELLSAFPSSGKRRAAFEAEVIEDTFAGGCLVSRVFSRVSRTRGSLVVTYSKPGYRNFEPPRMTTLENRAYGYRLEVETSEISPLD